MEGKPCLMLYSRQFTTQKIPSSFLKMFYGLVLKIRALTGKLRQFHAPRFQTQLQVGNLQPASRMERTIKVQLKLKVPLFLQSKLLSVWYSYLFNDRKEQSKVFGVKTHQKCSFSLQVRVTEQMWLQV